MGACGVRLERRRSKPLIGPISENVPMSDDPYRASLSTIMHAERIYVLERGHIVEQGTDSELVAETGLYYAL